MRIALVACCNTKSSEAGPARQVYTSVLFQKSLAYAERIADRVFILSAKLGLVEPDQWIEPYQVALRDMTREQREAWAVRVREQLPAGEYVYLAGRLYRENLPAGEVPMVNLRIGKQLKWLVEALQ